jgi:hypothetical protein
VAHRFGGHHGGAREEDRGLAESAQVLGAAVPVGMLAIGRATAESHGEEREHRGHHVAA